MSSLADALASVSAPVSSNSAVTKTVDVTGYAGLVIGQKGTRIQLICDKFDVEMWVEKEVLYIRGTAENVARTTKHVISLIERKRSKQNRPQPRQTVTKELPRLTTAGPSSPAPNPHAQTSHKAQWFWQDDQGEWVRYERQIEAMLEASYPSSTGEYVLEFETSEFAYAVLRKSDGSLVQLNLKTRKQRPVRRKGNFQSFA